MFISVSTTDNNYHYHHTMAAPTAMPAKPICNTEWEWVSEWFIAAHLNKCIAKLTRVRRKSVLPQWLGCRWYACLHTSSTGPCSPSNKRENKHFFEPCQQFWRNLLLFCFCRPCTLHRTAPLPPRAGKHAHPAPVLHPSPGWGHLGQSPVCFFLFFFMGVV